MISEKQVKDITKEELEKVVKYKENRVASKINDILRDRINIEKRIKNLEEDLVKVNAELTKLEGLTVEEAYELIQSIYSLGSVWFTPSNYANIDMSYVSTASASSTCSNN